MTRFVASLVAAGTMPDGRRTVTAAEARALYAELTRIGSQRRRGPRSVAELLKRVDRAVDGVLGRKAAGR